MGRATKRVARSKEKYLTRKLKPVVNQQKIRICSTTEVEFLGFSFQGDGGQIRVSPKTVKKFKTRVCAITRCNRGMSMERRPLEIRRYFHGWAGPGQPSPYPDRWLGSVLENGCSR